MTNTDYRTVAQIVAQRWRFKMAEYFNRDSLIKAICKIGDDSKGSWSTSSIVDFLLNQPVANVEEVIWGHW